MNDRYQRISFSQSPTGSLVSRHVNSSEEAKKKMLSLHSQFFLKLSLGIDKEVISFAGISRPCQFIDTLPQLFCLKDTVNPNRKVLLG